MQVADPLQTFQSFTAEVSLNIVISGNSESYVTANPIYLEAVTEFYYLDEVANGVIPPFTNTYQIELFECQDGHTVETYYATSE